MRTPVQKFIEDNLLLVESKNVSITISANDLAELIRQERQAMIDLVADLHPSPKDVQDHYKKLARERYDEKYKEP